MPGQLVIVPGAPAAGGVSALVLIRGIPAHASVTVAQAGGAAPAPVPAPLQRAPFAIQRVLDAMGVRTYLVRVSGLPSDRAFVLRASAGVHETSFAFRTLPDALPDDGFTLAFATCYYKDYPLHAAIAASLRSARLVKPPAALLLLGDNVYMDVPRPAQTAFEVVERYVAYLFDPGVAQVRSLLPTFTTWDDHEFWNDFPEPQFHLTFTMDAARRDAVRDTARECIDFFQARLNPELKPPPQPRHRSYGFELLPLRFFIADTRTERTSTELMPEHALHALEAFLDDADGPCVLALGQPLWIPARSKLLGLFTSDHNPPFFRAQYDRIWAALERCSHDVLVLSGDVHYSRVLRISPGTLATNRSIFECVSSPLCHIPKPLQSAQDQSAISDPARLPERPQARAQYLFGTSANASFGLLHFSKLPGGVRVGAAFIDARSGRPAPLVGATNLGPSLPAGLPHCQNVDAFALRQR